MTDTPDTTAKKLEHVITVGGKFPNAYAVANAIVQFNTKTVKKLVMKFHEMPEERRKALGIAANLLLTVLENELKRRTGRKPRQKK